jgi:hypothetical protein
MAICAVLGSGWVQGAIPPVFSHFAVAFEANCRLTFFLEAGMG